MAGLADVRPWDDRDVPSLRAVPRRLLVVGGGAVGLEMAQAVKRLGADEGGVIEAAPSLLVREEPFAGQEVRTALEGEGIEGGRLHPAWRTFVGDEVLVAAGRAAATGDLGLASVGLPPGAPIGVDERLSARGVDGGWLYAVGDCNGIALLTHMGKYQARIAADVILGKDGVDRASRTVVPRSRYRPKVIAVGLTSAQAAEQGVRVRTVAYGTGDVAGASVQGPSPRGTSALVVDEDRRVLVGATFVGSGTQELVHAATVAIAGCGKPRRLVARCPVLPHRQRGVVAPA